MRDYAKISGNFWVSKLGKLLRQKNHAQTTALYLMTSPHSNMIGLYYCPPIYIAHETGLSQEDSIDAINYLGQINFCTYDWDTEFVFIREFTKHQVGDSIQVADLRHKGILNQLAKIPEGPCKQAFLNRYRSSHHLLPIVEKEFRGDAASSPRAPKAPRKPEAGKGEISEARVRVEKTMSPDSPPLPLPDDYKLPDQWRRWAETSRLESNWDIDLIFRKFLTHKSKKKLLQSKEQWFADWQLWILSERQNAPRSETMTAVTIPGRKGKCDALLKLDADSTRAVPMPPEILEYAAKLRGKMSRS